MEIFEKFTKNDNLSLALGFFDGLHSGHKKVISNAVREAEKRGGKSGVVTFYDHPTCFFKNVQPKYLLERKTRIKMLEELGVDYLYQIKFDENISTLEPKDYLNILVDNFHPTSITTGFNHYFGKDKKGDSKLLNSLQNEYGYKYFEIEPKIVANEVVSTSLIKKNLLDGEIELANSRLGYEFFIEGEVVEGQKIGRTIGFPTANLNYPAEIIELPYGVYKTEAEIDGEKYASVTNYGLRPSVASDNSAFLEVHLKNFDKDIYGKVLKINFLKKIRNEIKFNSLQELQVQIKKDIELC